MADYIYIRADTEINLDKYQTGDRILIIGSESNLQNISFSNIRHYRIDLFGKGLSGYESDSSIGAGYGLGGYSSFEFTPTSEIFQLVYNNNYLYVNSSSLSFLEPKYRALAVAGSAGEPRATLILQGTEIGDRYKSGHGGGLEGHSYSNSSDYYSGTVCSGQTARSGTVWMSTNNYGGFGWYSGNTSDTYGGGGGSGFILGKTTTTYPSGFYGDDPNLLEKVSSTIGDSWNCVTGGRRGNSLLMELLNITSTHTYGDITVHYNPETRLIGSAESNSTHIYVNDGIIVITVGDLTYNPETQAVVSFDTNGGYPIVPMIVDKGSSFEMVVPTREPANQYQLCEFVSWYKDGVPFEEGTIIEEDMTLRASWLIKQLKVLNPYYKKEAILQKAKTYKVVKTQKYIPAGFYDIETTRYPYTGQSQTVTLDPGLYRFRCWGAQGGSYNNTYQGGAGGYSEGVIRLEATTTLYLYVGGQPKPLTSSGTSNAGFNGGGTGTYHCFMTNTYSTYPQGGGGATDIRIGSDSLYARVIVAGGGAGSSNSYNALKTRFGGGLSSGGYSGYEATQTKGYSFGKGQSGDSENTDYMYAAPGSGGGWYGGKSSTSYSDSTSYSSYSAGGSGYVYTEETASNYPSGCLLNSSYYLSDAQTIAGNMSIPDPNDFSQTTIGRTGNGYITISKVEERPGEWVDEITLEPIDLFHCSVQEEL